MEVKWLEELHIGRVSNVELDSEETRNERMAMEVCGVSYFFWLSIYPAGASVATLWPEAPVFVSSTFSDRSFHSITEP